MSVTTVLVLALVSIGLTIVYSEWWLLLGLLAVVLDFFFVPINPARKP